MLPRRKHSERPPDFKRFPFAPAHPLPPAPQLLWQPDSPPSPLSLWTKAQSTNKGTWSTPRPPFSCPPSVPLCVGAPSGSAEITTSTFPPQDQTSMGLLMWRQPCPHLPALPGKPLNFCLPYAAGQHQATGCWLLLGLSTQVQGLFRQLKLLELLWPGRSPGTSSWLYPPPSTSSAPSCSGRVGHAPGARPGNTGAPTHGQKARVVLTSHPFFHIYVALNLSMNRFFQKILPCSAHTTSHPVYCSHLLSGCPGL